MNSNLVITEEHIGLVNKIDGVEISASRDYLNDEWCCVDGFNAYTVKTQAEAIANVQESIDFYT